MLGPPPEGTTGIHPSASHVFRESFSFRWSNDEVPVGRAKAERLDDASNAQLAFDKVLAEALVLDAADDAEDGDKEGTDVPGSQRASARRRTGPPPTGRRKLNLGKSGGANP